MLAAPSGNQTSLPEVRILGRQAHVRINLHTFSMFKVDRLTRKCELVPLSGNDVGLFPSNLVTKMITGTMLTFERPDL